FTHVVIVLVPAASVDHMSFGCDTQLQCTEVVFVDRQSLMEGEPKPRQAVEDVCSGEKVHGSRYRVQTAEDMDWNIDARSGQGPPELGDVLHPIHERVPDFFLGNSNNV